MSSWLHRGGLPQLVADVVQADTTRKATTNSPSLREICTISHRTVSAFIAGAYAQPTDTRAKPIRSHADHHERCDTSSVSQSRPFCDPRHQIVRIRLRARCVFFNSILALQATIKLQATPGKCRS